MNSKNNIHIGTVLRKDGNDKMHILVTKVVTKGGEDYCDATVLSDEDGSVWATIENCIISPDWKAQDSSTAGATK